jgi:hypothetical protein
MCGNSKQPKKRIEYRGNILRVYGTEGVSPTKTLSRDVHRVNINTNHSVRLHKRLFKGTRIGLQRGKFQKTIQ